MGLSSVCERFCSFLQVLDRFYHGLKRASLRSCAAQSSIRVQGQQVLPRCAMERRFRNCGLDTDCAVKRGYLKT